MAVAGLALFYLQQIIVNTGYQPTTEKLSKLAIVVGCFCVVDVVVAAVVAACVAVVVDLVVVVVVAAVNYCRCFVVLLLLWCFQYRWLLLLSPSLMIASASFAKSLSLAFCF